MLKEILEELKELRLLYKELVEKLVPVEELLEDEKEAIEASDEVVGEEKILRALRGRSLEASSPCVNSP